MAEPTQATIDLGAEVWRRKEACWNEMRLWEPTWRELNEFINPNKKRAGETRTAGGKQTERLYDPTAVNDNRKLANYLNGAVISGSTRWFSLITRDPAMMRDREVSIWLDDTATKIYSALQQSNLGAVAPQAFASLSRLGTSALFEEEKPVKVPGFNGLQFTVIPVGQFACDENASGQIDVLYRDFQLSAIAAAGFWGLEKLPTYLQEAYKTQPHGKHWFTQAIMPKGAMAGQQKSRFAFVSYYLDHRERVLLEEGGYEELPFFVPRWETEEGEVYGRGCGHIALPDIRSLNKTKELGLQALALQVRPPLMVPHDGVRGGKTRLTPASENVMLDDREIKPIQLGQDLRSEMVKGEELRANIHDIFYQDMVELPGKNYMTATEVIQQMELINRRIGPTLGNIQTGWLQLMIDRTFNIMLRAKVFLPPPEVLAGAELDIEYEGPLARAQRTGDMTALQTALALTTGLAQVDPEVMDNIDTDEVMQYQFEVLGLPTRMLRSKANRAKVRESRAQAAQQQQQMEGAQQVADVALTGAQAVQTAGQAMQPQGTA